MVSSTAHMFSVRNVFHSASRPSRLMFEEIHNSSASNTMHDNGLISIITFSHDHGDGLDSDCKVYVCRETSGYQDMSFSVEANDTHIKSDATRVIRFDPSTHIPIINKVGDGNVSIEDKINLLSESMANILGDENIVVKPIYSIHALLDASQINSFQKRSRNKASNEKYAVVTKWNSIDENEIIGFVCSVHISNDDTSSETTGNLVPIPLLSVTLSRIKIDNDSNRQGQRKTLMVQCLKRQLVGKLVVCGRASSIVKLRIPSLNGIIEIHHLKVDVILPLRKDSLPYSQHEKYYSRTFIYQIMPSTRIILELGSALNETFHRNTMSIDGIEIEKRKMRCQHEKILVNTILAIRQCSKINEKPEQHFDSVRFRGLDIPRVFLLSGSPGVGKTYGVRKTIEVSKQFGPTKLISIRGSELLANGSESDAAFELTKIFKSAISFASQCDICVSLLFMDECDALFSSNIVSATLASLLDEMSSKFAIDAAWKRLVVVAATNRIDAVPDMLRRPGRFDRELCIPPPDATQRLFILKNILRDFEISMDNQKDNTTNLDDADLMEISEMCVGFVPSDLAALVRKVFVSIIHDGTANLSKNSFIVAMKDVGASALRDSVISAPPTTRWSDIAGDAGGAKTALRQAIEWPKLKRKQFVKLGLNPPRGILLHGPPGCAKTTLVRAAAGSTGVAFLSLSPAEVYASSYVGEAEGVVRRAFALARSASPCILFFDEIDTIVGSSNNHGGMERGKNAEALVLSTFLNEMDGIDGSINDGVLVVGATNRPSTLDAAILRPGRFDRVIYVPPPDQEGRKQILASQCDVNLIDVGQLSKDEITGSMTGAEIVGTCREAAMLALREVMAGKNNTVIPSVTQSHVEKSLKACIPLLSDKKVLEEYTMFELEQNKK